MNWRRLGLGLAWLWVMLNPVPVLMPPALSAPNTISAPVLKWGLGGCNPNCETGWYSSPAVADVDNDGKPEVLWGAYDVVVLNGENGTEQWRGPSNLRVWPGVAVADLTGNGSLEIIVGRSTADLTVYNNAGGVVWTRTAFTTPASGEIRTLAVSDLERDGQLEIIVGRASGGETKQLNVYEPDGSIRPGWPARRDGEPGYGWGMYNQNVTIADLDGDGNKEIFGPTDTHYITALDRNGNQLPASTFYGSNKVWSQVGVHVLQSMDVQGYANCSDSYPLAERLRPNFADASPAIADVNGDGMLEIIFPGDVYDCSVGDPGGDQYYLPWILKLDRTRWSGSGYDWTVLPTPHPNSGPLIQDYTVIESSVTNAVVADLDSDGKKEILYASYDGQVHAYWLDKTEHGNWPYAVYTGGNYRFASEPVVADLDSDGQAEVLFTTWTQKGSNERGQLLIVSSTGALLQAVTLPASNSTWDGALAAPTLANIDVDPDFEVVVGTAHTGVVTYDLPNTANARILWSTGRGSYLRTGASPTCNTLAVAFPPAPAPTGPFFIYLPLVMRACP